jgi:hypothetical protein
MLLLQMLKLGTKFSSIQEQLLQQERKERVTTLGAARNKQVFSTWNNTSLTFRAALNSSQSPCKQEEIAEKIVCVCEFSLSLNCLSFFHSVGCSLSLSLSLSLALFACCFSLLKLSIFYSPVLFSCVCVCVFFACTSLFCFPFFISLFFSPLGLWDFATLFGSLQVHQL